MPGRGAAYEVVQDNNHNRINLIHIQKRTIASEYAPWADEYYWSSYDNRFLYVKDHLGSIRQTLNESGVVMSATDYYAFGGTLSSYVSGSAVDKYKFTSKERDLETGYDYFGARYYDSKVGRWMSVDPLASKYPGWSPYNYCFNNPLMLIDPDGKEIKVKKDTNEDGSVHYTITYTATIVYNPNSVPIEQIAALSATITSQIQESFSGSQENVSWSAVADIQYASGPRAGDNIIKVANLPEGEAGASAPGGKTQIISRALLGRNDHFEWGRTGAHEFGHAAGLAEYGQTWLGGNNYSGMQNPNESAGNLMQQSDRTSGTKINFNQIKEVVKHNKK